MNFRILYTLYFTLVFAVLFTIGASIVSKDMREGFRDGYNDGYAQGVDPKESNYPIWRGYMIPISSTAESSGALGNLSKDSSLVRGEVKVLDILVKNNGGLPKVFHYYRIASYLLSLVVLVLVLYLLGLLYKLFIRMQKTLRERKVFSMGVVRVLRSLGIVLIVMEVIGSVFYYVQVKAAQIVLTPYGYDVNCSIDPEYIAIIFGIALLLVSEFLKIGYKIQEEQDLTV